MGLDLFPVNESLCYYQKQSVSRCSFELDKKTKEKKDYVKKDILEKESSYRLDWEFELNLQDQTVRHTTHDKYEHKGTIQITNLLR